MLAILIKEIFIHLLTSQILLSQPLLQGHRVSMGTPIPFDRVVMDRTKKGLLRSFSQICVKIVKF